MTEKKKRSRSNQQKKNGKKTSSSKKTRSSSSSKKKTKSTRKKVPEAKPGELKSDYVSASPVAIEDGTPASEAILVNASIVVTRVDKVLRKLKLNIFRRNKSVNSTAEQESQNNNKSTRSSFGYRDLWKNVSGLGKPPESTKSLKSMKSMNGKESSNSEENGLENKGSKIKPEAEREELSLNERRRRIFHKHRKAYHSNKKKRSYLKGKKIIDENHQMYIFSIAVMLGLRTSIAMTNGQLLHTASNQKVKDKPSSSPMWLTNDDFMAVEKYAFRPKGGPKTPPHLLAHTFKFKDYSPKVFAYIRRMFGVNEYDFLSSVCGDANFIEFVSNAKSGQFFFWSNDGNYMVKTMSNSDSKVLRRIMPHYFRHCALNPNTLVIRFFGMYRVKMYHLHRNIKFVVMNNVYDTVKTIDSIFDLKGSVTGRDAKPHDEVKKDNDVRRGLPYSSFRLFPEVRERLRKQVERDVAFLTKMKIMDYSMLVGVHHVPVNVTHDDPINNHRKNLIGTADHVDDSIRGLLEKRSRSVAAAASGFRDKPELKPVQKAYLKANLPNSSSSDNKSLDGSFTERFINPEINAKKYSSPDSNNHLPNASVSAGTSFSDLFIKPEINDKRYCNTGHGHSTSDLDKDDDSSYLESDHHRFSSVFMSPSSSEDFFRKNRNVNEKSLELRKLEAAEQKYWPFQRFYDCQGYRRMVPEPFPSSSFKQDPKYSKGSWKVPEFAYPISNRKDSGITMDVSGMKLPISLDHSEECDGMLIYMGVIDILQQFTTVKRLEARYRRLRGKDPHDASCVHPTVYADRFLKFFDQYTKNYGSNLNQPLPRNSSVKKISSPRLASIKTIKRRSSRSVTNKNTSKSKRFTLDDISDEEDVETIDFQPKKIK